MKPSQTITNTTPTLLKVAVFAGILILATVIFATLALQLNLVIESQGLVIVIALAVTAPITVAAQITTLSIIPLIKEQTSTTTGKFTGQLQQVRHDLIEQLQQSWTVERAELIEQLQQSWTVERAELIEQLQQSWTVERAELIEQLQQSWTAGPSKPAPSQEGSGVEPPNPASSQEGSGVEPSNPASSQEGSATIKSRIQSKLHVGPLKWNVSDKSGEPEITEPETTGPDIKQVDYEDPRHSRGFGTHRSDSKEPFEEEITNPETSERNRSRSKRISKPKRHRT